jgi:succinate dehydrogenase/fumarate reductase flavoprotein subunit
LHGDLDDADLIGRPRRVSLPDADVFEADVLIIGGGMAAAWSAIGAAREGAAVILVDKGFVGSSGVTAAAGPGHWWVPPDPGLREAAIEKRYQSSLGLADREWMARIIDTTFRELPKLTAHYPFAPGPSGDVFYPGVRGPEYMRALRRTAEDHGVTILDHHPALELLRHRDGSVAGAAGYARLARRSWTIRAGTVILATGGCAFRSGLIGSHTNTGDGQLMAAEAGAELSGMEFSAVYSLSPVWCSTRTLPFTAARFYDTEGAELDIPPATSGAAHNRALAKAMLAGPVLADLVDAPPLLRTVLRRIQPKTTAAFERRGVDLFETRFPVKLFGEGTIRGTGGLRIVDDACQTTVPGLYAVGDAASRERVTGAISGGGSVNSAWALTSGLTAGARAARITRRLGRRAAAPVEHCGTAGLRPTGPARPIDEAAVVKAVGAQILDYDKAFWRRRETLQASQNILQDAWRDLARHGRAEGLAAVSARETAALAATARWCVAAALERQETRGIHLRADAPDLGTGGNVRLLVGGLDEVWTRPESRAAYPAPVEAAA